MTLLLLSEQAVRAPQPCDPHFESLVPSIERCASYAFRKLPPHQRQENIADVVANAFVAFTRLIERGLEALIYPTALAQFAIRRVRSGRELAVRQNVTDVLSPYAQSQQGIVVERLYHSQRSGQWQERLVEDRRATPDELVACKLDFSAWLDGLCPHKRRIALRLAGGDTTCEAARYFRVTAARISQLRRELQAAWNEFQGEELPAPA
jgi:hypothetical protein